MVEFNGVELDEFEYDIARFVNGRSQEIAEVYGFKYLRLYIQPDGHPAFEFALKEPFECRFPREGEPGYGVPGAYIPYTYRTEEVKYLGMVADMAKEVGPIKAYRPPRPVAAQTIVRTERQVRPNDRCPCGSGKKFKKCCMGS